MSDFNSVVLKVAASNPEFARLLKAEVAKEGGNASFWERQYRALDKVLPRWDANKVRDFNKVLGHYRASGLNSRAAGAAAHYYSEYRAGRMSLQQAAKGAASELPNAKNVLGEPLAKAAKVSHNEDALKQEEKAREKMAGLRTAALKLAEANPEYRRLLIEAMKK